MLINSKRHLAERRLTLFFLVPCLLFLLFIVVFPLFYNLILSFTNMSLLYPAQRKFTGLQNFVDIFKSKVFYLSVLRTFIFSFSALVVECILALLIALLLNQDYPGRGIIQILLMLPFIATPVAISYVWRIMYNPDLGIINYILKVLRLPAWGGTFSGKTALASLVIVDVWQWTPFLTLMFLAALLSMPKEPLEAADIDGAKGWQKLVYVTLPLVKNVLVIGIILRFIDLYKTFDIIYVLTGGGPGRASETLNIRIYHELFSEYEVGYSAALTIIAIIIISFMLNMFAKRTELGK